MVSLGISKVQSTERLPVCASPSLFHLHGLRSKATLAGSEKGLMSPAGRCWPILGWQSETLLIVAGKLAGLDKKLSRNLDQEVQLGSSPLELSKSPVGPLAESSR